MRYTQSASLLCYYGARNKTTVCCGELHLRRAERSRDSRNFSITWKANFSRGSYIVDHRLSLHLALTLSVCTQLRSQEARQRCCLDFSDNRDHQHTAQHTTVSSEVQYRTSTLTQTKIWAYKAAVSMIHGSPPSRRRSNGAWRAPTALAAPSLLLLAEAASHGASAFLVPVITTPRTAIYSRASSLFQTSATEAEGGEDKSPAGLTLEEVYKRLKLDSIGVDDGGVSLDSTDPEYGVSFRTHSTVVVPTRLLAVACTRTALFLFYFPVCCIGCYNNNSTV